MSYNFNIHNFYNTLKENEEVIFDKLYNISYHHYFKKYNNFFALQQYRYHNYNLNMYFIYIKHYENTDENIKDEHFIELLFENQNIIIIPKWDFFLLNGTTEDMMRIVKYYIRLSKIKYLKNEIL